MTAACRLAAVALLAAMATVQAQPSPAAATPTLVLSEALESRAFRLEHRLRCVVCQNQTIAESNAPLAADMRRVVREQMQRGRSDEEIVHFFEQRYGAFVRYAPPWQPSTWLLWLGPFLVLGAGLAGLVRSVRRRAERMDAIEASA